MLGLPGYESGEGSPHPHDGSSSTRVHGFASECRARMTGSLASLWRLPPCELGANGVRTLWGRGANSACGLPSNAPAVKEPTGILGSMGLNAGDGMAADRTGVSRRAYAKSRRISEAVVRKYLAQGKLSDALLPDGTLDAEKADRLSPPPSHEIGHQPVELRTAKARRLRAQVRRLGDEVRDLEKSLVHSDRVRPIASIVGRIVADNLRPIAERMAPIIAGMNGKDAHLALRNAVSDALEIISSTMVTPSSYGLFSLCLLQHPPPVGASS